VLLKLQDHRRRHRLEGNGSTAASRDHLPSVYSRP